MGLLVGIKLSAQNYAFDYYGLRSDIPSEHVTSIYQGKDGLLFFGFTQGIRIYDSYNFSNIRVEHERAYHEAVNSFCETSQNYYFNTSTHIYKGKGSDFKRIAFKGSNNQHELSRIFSYHDTVFALTTRGIYKLTSSTLEKVVTHTALDTLSFLKYFLDSKDNLWLIVKKGELRVYNLRSRQEVTSRLLNKEWSSKEGISDVTESNTQTYYIALKTQGVYELQNRSVKPLKDIDGVKLGKNVLSLQYEKSSSTLWMASYEEGLIKYTGNKAELIAEQNGLKYKDIISILCDQEENIWLATSKNGIVKYKKNGIIHLGTQHGLPDKAIQKILPAEDGKNAYVLTSGGLALYQNKRITNLPKLNAKKIVTIQAVGNQFFVSYEDGTVEVINGAGEQQKNAEPSLLNKAPIHHFLKWKKSQLYVTGYFNLQIKNDSEKEAKNIKTDIDDEILCLEKSNGGDSVFIGTGSGLYVLDKHLRVTFVPLDTISFKNTSIQTIRVLGNKVYVATNCYGVFIYDLKSKEVKNLTKSDNLPSNNINNLIVLDSNTLIVASSKYLTKVTITPQKKTEVNYHYAENEDLYFTFSPNTVCALQASDELLIGSENGLLVFNNVLKNANVIAPKIVVNEILVNNERINWKEQEDSLNKNGLPVNLRLKSSVETIIIRFAGLKYSTNEGIESAYRFNGGDAGWISLGEGNELYLDDLPDGKFSIEIRAKGQSDKWGDPVSLSFDKHPPFWRTRFFGFLVLCVCIILFAAFFRYNQRFKKELVSEEQTGLLSLQAVRLMLFFAAAVIPSANLTYAVVNNVYDIKLAIMLGLSGFMLAASLSTYVSKYIQARLTLLMLSVYITMVCVSMSLVIIDNMSPFSVISFIFALTVSSLLIEQLKRYTYFAFFIIIACVTIVMLVDKPLYNPVLFAMAVLAALLISFMTILVKLNASQRLIFSNTVMNNGNTLVIASNKEGQVIFINNALSNLLGYKEEEVLGEGWWTIHEDASRPVSVKKSIVEGTLPKATLSLLKTKGGHYRWVQWENTRMSDNVTVSVGTDVTEKQEYEKRFSHIVENAKDIIYVTDANGNFTYVNDIAVQVTGFKKEELLAKNFRDLIKPEYRKQVSSFYLLQLRSKEQQSYLEFPILTKNDEVIWVGQQVMFMQDQLTQTLSGTQAICRDITKRVNAEEKLKIANSDLSMLNQVKEIILQSQDNIDVMIESVILKLHQNKRSTESFCVGILTKDNSVRHYRSKKVTETVLREIYNLTSEQAEEMKMYGQCMFHPGDTYPYFLEQDLNLLGFKGYVLIMPIRSKDVYYGYVNICTSEINKFKDDYISVLDDVINYLISAFNQLEQKQIISAKNEEIQLYLNQLEDVNDELKYENELKESVIYAKDVEDVCMRMLGTIMPASNKAYCYSFNIMDMDTQVLHVYQGFKDGVLQHHKIELNDYLRSIIYSSSSLLYLYEEDNPVNHELELFKQPIQGITCAILAPIQTLTTRYGFLGVYTKSVDVYNSVDVRRVESIASIISTFVAQYYANLKINTRNEQIQKYSRQLENINTDLEEQNKIKQLIISIKERDELFDELLEIIIVKSRYAQSYVINLYDSQRQEISIYSIRRENNIVYKGVASITDQELEFIEELDEKIYNHTHENFLNLLKLCLKFHQGSANTKTMMFKHIKIGDRFLGFIATYSNYENIYEKSDVKYLIELSSSLQNFLAREEQSKVIANKNVEIEKYSKRLELLNEARQLLIKSQTLKELYTRLIDLMYNRIDNVHRISFLIFDQVFENGDLYYLDSMSLDVAHKRIVTAHLPTLPTFKRNEAYDLPDLIKKEELTDDDKHWLNVRMQSVYCVPVFVNSRLFGAINLLSRQRDNFAEQKVIINEIKQSVELIIEQILYKDIISQKNKDINDNITYAKRIQTAIMPSPVTLYSLIPRSFLIFEQRDNLGGDFYWFYPTQNSILLAVADCTGHGVSGSLLTILASNYLQQAVKERQYTDPALILEHLNSSVRSSLNQTNSETEILDGLDISCINYLPKERLLYFSGAMHNLLIVRKGEIIEYKGNRLPIGSFNISRSKFFTTHLIVLNVGDIIFCTTDGYIDQLSDKRDKRFGRLRFKDLVLALAKLPVEERKAEMLRVHNEWKGFAEQTDDICVISFEVD